MIRTVCHGLLKLAGWRICYSPAPMSKAVIVVYPHTSNWDFVIGILFRYAVGIPLRFAAKDTLFWGPAGPLFRSLGGVPVNRRERTGFVTQMSEEFARQERLYLAITPEGTRSARPHLKSGFYRLAMAAKVPLAFGFIDYARREVGIDGYLNPTGDERVDLAHMAQVYAHRRGKYPSQQAPFIFAEMQESSQSKS